MNASPRIAINDNIETVFWLPAPKPVTWSGDDLVGEADPVEVAEPDPFVPVPPTLLPTRVKFEHVILVLFAKWTVRDKFPRNAGFVDRVLAKSSVYIVTKVSFAAVPCLPERSPTWQVCGRVSSQPGV